MIFKQRIIDQLATATLEEIDQFIIKHMKDFFDTPKIYEYYQLIKNHQCLTNETRLILSWMAQLSGDNMRLSILERKIELDQLTNHMLAFYYDLQALSGFFDNPSDRLAFSDKSLALFNENDHSFIHANAMLTRGQIHNGLHQYRKAHDYFYSAYELFLHQEMMFPSSVCLTNALISLTRLAKFDDCVKEGNKAMLMASSYKEELVRYWDVLYLPMGIAYLERNQVLLAIDYLEKAKKAIDDLDLIHMHGLIEYQLFRAYKIHGDMKMLQNLVKETNTLFASMRYPIMIQFLRYGELLADDYLTEQSIQELSVMYQESNDPQAFLVCMLMYVSNKNNKRYIDTQSFLDYIEQSRIQGDLVNLQMLLLLLADYYYIDNRIEEAKIIVKEIVRNIQEYDLIGSLYIHPYECWPLLKKMDPSLKKVKYEQPYFTEKELEIIYLLDQGLTNKDIAQKLFITIGTVKWHMNHILSKLQVKNRTQAVYEAKKIGLFSKK